MKSRSINSGLSARMASADKNHSLEDAWFDIRRLTTVLEDDVLEGTQLVVWLQKILGASPVYDHIVG